VQPTQGITSSCSALTELQITQRLLIRRKNNRIDANISTHVIPFCSQMQPYFQTLKLQKGGLDQIFTFLSHFLGFLD
jgi:hypothetical protein